MSQVVLRGQSPLASDRQARPLSTASRVCGQGALSDPEAMMDWGRPGGAKTVVLKLGGEGALASDGSTRQVAPLPRPRPREVGTLP